MIGAWLGTLMITAIAVGAAMAALGLGLLFGRERPRGTCASGACEFGACEFGAGKGHDSSHCPRRKESA